MRGVKNLILSSLSLLLWWCDFHILSYFYIHCCRGGRSYVSWRWFCLSYWQLFNNMKGMAITWVVRFIIREKRCSSKRFRTSVSDWLLTILMVRPSDLKSDIISFSRLSNPEPFALYNLVRQSITAMQTNILSF